MDDYFRDEESVQEISQLELEGGDASGAHAQEHIAAKQLPTLGELATPDTKIHHMNYDSYDGEPKASGKLSRVVHTNQLAQKNQRIVAGSVQVGVKPKI